MSYLVFARKYRPQSFAEVVGQEHITTALANAVLRDRVPHALLFTGPRGVGKTSIARIFAKSLNCLDRSADNAEACGKCTQCTEIVNSSSLAVREIDGASHNSVDNVRELTESLRSVPPPGVAYKVYIIDEVHMLSIAAFNALLKSLEEPPPNTVFVFATTEPHKIPDTVISRCQRHDYSRLPDSLISETLAHIAKLEKLEVDSAVFTFLARRAEGGMRDAQSMFDRLVASCSGKVTIEAAQQVFGSLSSDFFFELSEAVFSGNSVKCFELIQRAFEGSLDLRNFLNDLVTHFRNLLVSGLSSSKQSAEQVQLLCKILRLTSEEVQRTLEQVQPVGKAELSTCFDIVEETAKKALESNFPRYLLEAGLARAAARDTLGNSSLGQNIPSSTGRHNVQAVNASPVSAKKQLSSSEEEQLVVSQASAKKEKPAAQLKAERPQKVKASATVVEKRKVEVEEFSWADFVDFTKQEGELMLAAFLRRIAINCFVRGKLEIGGGSFDTESLRRAETREKLEGLLFKYSGHKGWELLFVEVSDAEASTEGNNSVSFASSSNGLLSGSLAEQDAQSRAKRTGELQSEIKAHPLVKATLETFSGSKLENISVVE